MLPALILFLHFNLSICFANKPDMQKVYAEALKFARKTRESSTSTLSKTEELSSKTQESSTQESKTQESSIQESSTKTQESLTQESKILPLKKPRIGVCRRLKNYALESAEKQESELRPNKLLVFVSFSMPKASLQALLKQAHKHNAVLLMRGLKDNSFKQTAELLKSMTEQGIEINPQLFTTYKITHVPVFVLLEGDKEINRLSGNVTMEFAAAKLREQL